MMNISFWKFKNSPAFLDFLNINSDYSMLPKIFQYEKFLHTNPKNLKNRNYNFLVLPIYCFLK